MTLPVMTIMAVMPAMAADVVMMLVVMNVRMMFRTMMRPCRGWRRERDDCQGTHRQCQDTRQPAQRN
jgi:hypothetical protein